jgi:1-acyl-sn-glycerol-3-phosphate acyltransferase
MPEVGPHPKAFLRIWMPLARLLAFLLFLVLGPIRVRGAYRVPREGGVLILANHLSDVDPVVVQYACPRAIHFMAKHELFEMPVVGWLIRKFRGFPVRRGEPDRQALKYSVNLLKAREAVAIFPEGEISEHGGLLPLKAGVALIARMAEAPAICCGVRDTQRIMPYGKTTPRPSWRTVEVVWGEPRTFGKETPPEDILAWAKGQLISLSGEDER